MQKSLEQRIDWCSAKLSSIVHAFEASEANEFYVNGAEKCFLKHKEELKKTTSPFRDDDELSEWLFILSLQQAGVRLDDRSLSAGGTLEGGRLRWHAVLPPAARSGPQFVLRKQRLRTLTLADFFMTREQRRLLDLHLRTGLPIVVIGKTGSGKTSFLSALLQSFSKEQRLAVLEDVAELPVLPGWIAVQSLPSQRGREGGLTLESLFREILRMSPDSVVLGELRGPEARAFVQASLTAEHRLITTLHAHSPAAAILRIQMLAQLAESEGSTWVEEVGKRILWVAVSRQEDRFAARCLKWAPSAKDRPGYEALSPCGQIEL